MGKDMYLIPQPKSIKTEGGVYWLNYDGKIIVSSCCSGAVDRYGTILKEEIKKYLGFSYLLKRGNASDHGIYLTTDENLSRQEYRLEIEKDGIVIEGGSDTAVLYGIQTLRQMIRQKGACLPCLVLEDRPDMEYRGFYHDITRGRIPTMDYLKSMADRLAFYKINQLQLYVEHSFLFEGLSEMWRDDTPITADEIIELDHYCRELGIELVPSISSFGHLYKLLRTKSYSHLCELENSEEEPFSFWDRMQHHTIDVSNEESFQLMKGLIEEFMPLFSSDKFNICADETFDLGKGRSKKLLQAVGQEKMYIDYVKRLCEFLVEKGKTPMFWGDIICDFPEAIKELPKETICLNWGYAPNQSEENTKKLYEAGAVQYSCPGVSGWNQFINLIGDSYENIKRMCVYAGKYHCVGVLNTDWGDFGHINHPDFGIIGMIYGAAFSWNTEIPEFEEINRQISAIEYEDSREAFVSIAAQASKLNVFGWEPAVRFLDYKRKHTPEEKIRAYLGQYDFSRVDACDEEIKEFIRKLYESILFLPIEKRSFIKPYIMAAEGIAIFNRIGIFVEASVCQDKKVPVDSCGELAKELETWFYRYKEIWRSVSRESELYRIQEIIFWYSDFLRDLDR